MKPGTEGVSSQEVIFRPNRQLHHYAITLKYHVACNVLHTFNRQRYKICKKNSEKVRGHLSETINIMALGALGCVITSGTELVARKIPRYLQFHMPNHIVEWCSSAALLLPVHSCPACTLASARVVIF